MATFTIANTAGMTIVDLAIQHQTAQLFGAQGTITDVSVMVGPDVPHDERATDLGEVGGAEAARFFLALADTSTTHAATACRIR